MLLMLLHDILYLIPNHLFLFLRCCVVHLSLAFKLSEVQMGLVYTCLRVSIIYIFN